MADLSDGPPEGLEDVSSLTPLSARGGRAVDEPGFKTSVATLRTGLTRLRRVLLAGLLCALIPAIAFAAGGGEVARLVLVADSRHLSGGLLFWANLYNESHVYFTLATVILIPSIGVTFGLFADLVMSRIGIDLSSRGTGGH